NWLYQTRDIMFQIKEWLGVEKLLSLDAYKEYYGMDDINSFLDVNFKVCRDVMCPANKDADEPGAKFVGGNEHAVVTPDSFKNVYRTVMDAELGPQFGYRGEGKSEMSRTFLSNVGRLVEQYKKPVAVTIITDAPALLNISRNQGYPLFTTPLMAAKALHASATYYEEKTARNARGEIVSTLIDSEAINKIKKLCKTEKRIPLTDEALQIAAAADIRCISGVTVKSATEADNFKIDFPVVVKLLSRDASHKSDVGGVQLNIKNHKELALTISGMKKAFQEISPQPAIDGFLVQKMAEEGVECFVGGRQDPVFGPIVIAGLGGVFLEIFKDTAIRLAPITKNEAMDMLKNLKTYPVLQGARGKIKADIDALADVICKVSNLLAKVPDIAEIDLNPVIVHETGKGVSIVDSRVFFK
ncbi:MAG TPA: acetate--CoA ligase family protein, partial [Smithella sp.]|nr:acetate--CoA ligase family protein [Smithella sp.]